MIRDRSWMAPATGAPSAVGWSTVLVLVALVAACTAGPASPTPTGAASTASATASAATPTGSATSGATGSCPPTPTSAGEIVQMGVATAASCYGQTELTIQGFSLDCGGCGGVDVYDRSPDWLATFIPAYFIGPTAGAAGIDPTAGFPVFIDPATGIVFPAPGAEVQVTGHFNDPASPTCKAVPPPGYADPTLDPNDVIASCQRSFVVTSVSVITP